MFEKDFFLGGGGGGGTVVSLYVVTYVRKEPSFVLKESSDTALFGLLMCLLH